jgi:hypothetical protein
MPNELLGERVVQHGFGDDDGLVAGRGRRGDHRCRRPLRGRRARSRQEPYDAKEDDGGDDEEPGQQRRG